MEDFVINMAVSTVLLLLKNPSKARRWTSVLMKLRDALIALDLKAANK